MGARPAPQNLHLARPVRLHPDGGRDGIHVPQERTEQEDRVVARGEGHERQPLVRSCVPPQSSPCDWETRVMEFVLIAIAILVVALVAAVGLLVGKGRRTTRLGDDAVSSRPSSRHR